MSDQQFAQVGDTIEITNDRTPLFGGHFVVIPRPEAQKIEIKPGDAWILDTKEWQRVIDLKCYKIIRTADVQDTKSVDFSLEKQRDANLRSVFC